jgi:hypothetical protein
MDGKLKTVHGAWSPAQIRSLVHWSLVPKLRLGILKPEAPASRLFLWHGRERPEPVGKQSFLLGFPSGAWETVKGRHARWEAGIQCHGWQAQNRPWSLDSGTNSLAGSLVRWFPSSAWEFSSRKLQLPVCFVARVRTSRAGREAELLVLDFPSGAWETAKTALLASGALLATALLPTARLACPDIAHAAFAEADQVHAQHAEIVVLAIRLILVLA